MKENLLLLKDSLEPYIYMTSITKNVYIDKLDVIVVKYNNKHHSTIKMKPVDVKSRTYINSSKFKIGNIFRISKLKIFLHKVLFKIDLKKFL